MAGSVKDYFLKQSYNQLEIDFDVVGPYTTKYDMKYYGRPSGSSNDFNPYGMVAEAIDAAAADVDYSKYDWDGDGEVDQVFIIFAGYNQAQGADENTIWPHEWKLSSTGYVRNYNGVSINTYGCSSELKGDGVHNTGILDGIGTACHEFSHCLGLPDMYDTSGNSFAMSDWDIMSSGNYNDGSRTPAGYTSYERMFSGWMQPKELNSLTHISGMKPLATDAEAYILYNEANHNEYYLLENRQLTGFDAGLPGHGLLVLHVDYNESAWAGNTVNTSENHQRMTIIPADGAAYTSSSSLAGDPFPGTKGNMQLTDYTSPAATLYNKNTDGRLFMGKPLTNITESSDGLISFVVCHPGVTPPVVSEGVEKGSGSFTISWNAVPDATSYEIELTEIPAAKHDTAECKRIEILGSQFYSKSVGFSDISKQLANYGLSGNWSGSKLFTSPNGLKMGTTTAPGNLSTPWYIMAESGELTLVLGTTSQNATGNVYFATADGDGNYIVSSSVEEENIGFEFTKPGRMVFHLNSLKGAYKLGVLPDNVFYLDYLAVYEGTFSAEELGIAEETGRLKNVRRRVNTSTITASGTSYTFTGLDPTSTFQYRVRAIGPEATSGWSDSHEFSFSATGIDSVLVEKQNSKAVYTLDGRRVDTDASLPKGIYIRNGKKVIR
jgi:M6 family metalloprotease-like protein